MSADNSDLPDDTEAETSGTDSQDEPGLGFDLPAATAPEEPAPADAAPPQEQPREAATEPEQAIPAPSKPSGNGDAYRVLARKYRPGNFDGLVGQEALVRTLTNAIKVGRIAQAFMLTGVRGVGKTTTARIIAKALNCIGPDGKGSATANPCGECEHCVAIAQDRHVDVIEMDAASRTGVNDIRELIEGVRYRPVSARYKLYILDEVHMLSNSAWNALLKTLEEPPEHVKFVFATTEIRKVPVTVLSRCQRFDLRRVPVEMLDAHFRKVAEAEGIGIETDALAMITRAADGSVRDGLSILDQAIALSDDTVTASQVRDMLGLADRGRIYDLFEAAMSGKGADALAILDDLYAVGADPVVVIQDLLDVTHWLTRAKLVPGVLDRPTTPELERSRGRTMADQLTMPILSRAWQMLMKGLGEVQQAPVPIQAAEMVLIRLIHSADLPPPGDLVKKLQEIQTAASAPTTAPSGGGNGSGQGSAPETSARSGVGPAAEARAQTQRFSVTDGGRQTAAMRAEAPRNEPQDDTRPLEYGKTDAEAEPEAAKAMPPQLPESFRDLVSLIENKREALLATQLKRDVHLVRFEPGRLEIRPVRSSGAKELTQTLGKKLSDLTGARWVVSISNEPGEPTLAEQNESEERARFKRAEVDPLVQKVMSVFPNASITRVGGSGNEEGSSYPSSDTSSEGMESSADTIYDDGYGEDPYEVGDRPDEFDVDTDGVPAYLDDAPPPNEK